jgi:hypothetical protein
MVQDLEQRGMLGAAQAGELLLVVAEGLRGEELGNQRLAVPREAVYAACGGCYSWVVNFLSRWQSLKSKDYSPSASPTRASAKATPLFSPSMQRTIMKELF